MTTEEKAMGSNGKIALPKDAEGRKIPLDTKVLYSLSGEEHKVDEFTYSPSENIWRVALAKQSMHFYTCDMHLAPVVVLCADGKPVRVGDTVYCDDDPERTCKVTHEYSGKQFPHCIHVKELSCGHEFRYYEPSHVPNYCPECGARVVS